MKNWSKNKHNNPIPILKGISLDGGWACRVGRPHRLYIDPVPSLYWAKQMFTKYKRGFRLQLLIRVRSDPSKIDIDRA